MIDFTAGIRESIRWTWANIFVPLHLVLLHVERGFPGGSLIKNLPANAGDMGLIPGLGRSPGEENGKPLQYSCLANPMDRGVWWATIHRITKELDTTEWLTFSSLQHVDREKPSIQRVNCKLYYSPRGTYTHTHTNVNNEEEIYELERFSVYLVKQKCKA